MAPQLRPRKVKETLEGSIETLKKLLKKEKSKMVKSKIFLRKAIESLKAAETEESLEKINDDLKEEISKEGDENEEGDDDDDGLECTICFEQFDDEERTPMQFECGHSLCKSCSTKIDNPVECPFCRGRSVAKVNEAIQNLVKTD